MKTIGQFGASFGAGVVAGAVYFLLQAQTPAPPWPALLGLLGILSGESLGRYLIQRLGGRVWPRGGSEPTRYEDSIDHP